MAIAFDSASSANASAFISGVTTVTWNHTVAVGATLLVTGIFPGFTSDLMTAATFNGTAMTRIAVTSPSFGSTEVVYLYYINNPASGIHAVSFTFSSNVPNAVAGAASYTGTDTTSGVIDSSHIDYFTSPTSSTTLVQTTTVVKTGCWLVGFGRNNNGTTTGVSPGSLRGGYAAGGAMLWDTNATVGTGSQSATVTAANSAFWEGIVASVAIPSAVTIPVAFRSLLGVGI